MRRLLALLVVPPLLVATGCGSDSSSSSTDTADEVFPGVSVTGAAGAEPDVQIDAPFDATKTSTQVIDQGDGRALKSGDTALVRYIGLNGRTGDAFDNSWTRGDAPVAFPLTPGSLIQGFLTGLVGQEVGSRVAIAITPDDGYGPAGGNPQINVEKDDSLVFVVDVVSIVPPKASGDRVDLPAGYPRLRLGDDGLPTGFTADGATGPAPKDVRAAPVIVGAGDKVEKGQSLTLNYLAQIYPDGHVVDSTFAAGGSTITAVAGSGSPKCWDALVGQTVGSRVALECPPGSVFDASGNKQLGVTGHDTLLFVMDLLAAG